MTAAYVSRNVNQHPLTPPGPSWPEEPEIRSQEDGEKDEFKRLCTFPLRWSSANTKRYLVQNGFYFDKNSSLLICAFCCERFQDSENLLQEHSSRPTSCTLDGNIPLGDITNFRFEKHRLISFLLCSDWQAPVNPYDLAKSGFYWTGDADAVRCIYCRVEIRNWEVDDTADGEHRRWSGTCPFMNGRNVGNVALGSESVPSVIQDVTSKRRQISINRATDLPITFREGVEHLKEKELGVTRATPARHPEYVTTLSRLQSYELWPPSIKQTPDMLAQAGFFYKNVGDRVICFQCGGGLHNWGIEDEPWEEHAKWFPNCSYLILNKGMHYVEEVQKKEKNDTTPLKATPINIIANTANEISDSSPDEKKDQDEQRLCKVCFKNELGIVFLPCGHMATCTDCGSRLTACPICRTIINAYVRVFLP